MFADKIGEDIVAFWGQLNLTEKFVQGNPLYVKSALFNGDLEEKCLQLDDIYAPSQAPSKLHRFELPQPDS